MKFCTDKDIDKMLRALERTPGWTVGFTKRTHVKVVAPSGVVVIVAGSPSGGRHRANAMCDLRRAMRSCNSGA